MSDALSDLGVHIAASMAGPVHGHAVEHGELTILAHPEQIASVVTFLRDDPRCLFQTLIDICGVDHPGRTRRFDVVYHFLSMRLNQRVRVKLEADDTNAVPSIAGVHPCANWFEREAFDMYGILFSGHPDLRRILTDYNFQGYPLRKDFPLSGHVEVRYDAEQERVVYEPVKLAQAYRNFDFISPWEGMTLAPQAPLPGDEKATKTDDAG